MLRVWTVERCKKDSEAGQEGAEYVRNVGFWRNIDRLSEEKEGSDTADLIRGWIQQTARRVFKRQECVENFIETQ